MITARSDLTFFANFAELTTAISIFKDGADVSDASTKRHIAGFFPFPGRLADALTREAPGSCGYTAEARATGVIEIRALSLNKASVLAIYSKGDTSRQRAAQAPCVPDDGDGGPTNEDLCQLCLEWTWYYGGDAIGQTNECGSLTRCPAQ
jgi:hypothetical protein